MQSSKFIVTQLIERKGYLAQEINHLSCHCRHCENDTKPLPKKKNPRIVLEKEQRLGEAEAYRIIVKQLSSADFIGGVRIPDTFFAEGSSIVYYSKGAKKIRVKEGQSNIEVKKHFQERRRKGYNNITTLSMSFNPSIVSSDQNPSIKSNKQIAILTYKDNAQQILSESLLSKMLDKRKNDPFWEQVSHITLIPRESRVPIQTQKYHFERTIDSISLLQPFLIKMAEIIDSNYQKIEKSGAQTQLSFLKNEEQTTFQQNFQINPQSKIMPPSPKRIKKSQLLGLNSQKKWKNSESLNFLDLSGIQHLKSEQLQLISFEMIAYLELSFKFRILNCKFQYFIQDRFLHLSKITDMIYVNLPQSQLTLIHDRYHPLQQTGNQQLLDLKIHYDQIQEKNLWKVCSAVVNDCLQYRKIQLKLTDYKKPSQQTLLKIFLKIFPQFKAQKIFSSINWKNDLTKFVEDTRKTINKVIRQDQGIRILKRFKITFYRTFK